MDDLLLRFCARQARAGRDRHERRVLRLAVQLPATSASRRRANAWRQADGLCARDLQAKSAERLRRIPAASPHAPVPGVQLAGRTARRAGAARRSIPDEVRVVSVGTFSLESQGMYDSGYLQLASCWRSSASTCTSIPHWFYRERRGSAFNCNLREDFVDFFTPAEAHARTCTSTRACRSTSWRASCRSTTSASSRAAAEAFGQKLKFLKPQVHEHLLFRAASPTISTPGCRCSSTARSPSTTGCCKRYGIAVDLGEILQPGFRERLLEHQAEQRARDRTVERARAGALARGERRPSGRVLRERDRGHRAGLGPAGLSAARCSEPCR